MKFFDVQLLMACLLWETVFAMTTDLEISRKGRRRGRDSFKISSSFYRERFNCEKFNAEATSNGDDYACLCPRNHSTFIFYNKAWGCRANEKVRTLLGGDTKSPFRFKREAKRNGLLVLKIKDRRGLRLNSTLYNCSQDGRARYSKCGGWEEALTERNPFELIAQDKKYYVKVINATSRDSLKGSIIKLKIICSDFLGGSTRSGVLLFKFEGSIHCSITIPFHPNSDRKRISSALIGGVTTVILLLLIITVFLVYRRQYLKRDPHPGRESEDRQETATLRANVENGSDNTNGDNELAYREAAVYASSYQVPVHDSEAHSRCERGSNDSPNKEHLYASLNIPEGSNVYGHKDDQETVACAEKSPKNGPASMDQPVHTLMEEINIAQPVFNSFEEPQRDVSHKIGQNGTISSDEPFHSALEEKCFRGNTLPMQITLESRYLKDTEESSQHGTRGPKEPVYNILEEPVGDDDDDPAYNILEAPEGVEDPCDPSAESAEEPMRHTLEQSDPNISEKGNDMKCATEPIYDTVDEDSSYSSSLKAKFMAPEKRTLSSSYATHVLK